MRSLIRRWLLGDVQKSLDCLLVQNALVIGTGENLVRQNGLVLKAIDELQVSLHALRDSEERHFRGTLSAVDGVHLRSENALGAIAKVGESVDRLVELVTPKAERLRGRRPVGGWDQVLTENLKQFEEAEKQ